MSTFEKAKVVMLSTNEPSKIGNLATYQKRSLAKVIKEGINPIGSTVQFWNLYIISDDEITSKKLLNTNDYYYIRNHYNEWYVGKFNGVSFDFINNDGNFDSNLFVCKKINQMAINSILDRPAIVINGRSCPLTLRLTLRPRQPIHYWKATKAISGIVPFSRTAMPTPVRPTLSREPMKPLISVPKVMA